MWVESKASFTSRERNFIEGSSTSHTILCYECFPSAHLSLLGVRVNDEFLLVGNEPKGEKRDKLGFMGSIVFTEE